jgi:hypothetical protein
MHCTANSFRNGEMENKTVGNKATRERERVMAACCHKVKLTVLLQVELHQADAPCAVRFMYGSLTLLLYNRNINEVS